MQAWEITKKDLRLLTRDRRALIVLVVLPLIFITIIGLTTGKLMGWNSANAMLKIALVDNMDYEGIGKGIQVRQEGEGDEKSESEAAEPLSEEERAVERKLARNMVVKIFNEIQARAGFEIREIESAEQARDHYEHGHCDAAIIVGPEFYRRCHDWGPSDVFDRSGRKPQEGLNNLDITLETSNPDSSRHSLVEVVVWSNVYRTVAPSVLCRFPLYRNRMPETWEALQAERDAAPIDPLPIKQQVVARGDEVYQNLVPSYTVMFVFFLVTVMARSFIHERELGTLRRLRIAPIRPTALLAGKTVPFLVISLVQTALLFICGRVLFDMSWGAQPLLLLPVIVCTSLAATALGLLLATLVRTESQVSAYANIVVITMAGISGCFMPRQWLPEQMQEASLVTPHAWSLMAYNQLLAQPHPSLAVVAECCAMLLGFALLYFVAGSVRFRSLG